MEQQEKRRAANEQKQRSKQIMPGDKVVIARRFFTNHGLQMYVVIGIVKEIVDVNTISLLCAYHHVLTYCKAQGFIQSLEIVKRNRAVIKINPVYLEKVDQHAKESNKRKSAPPV